VKKGGRVYGWCVFGTRQIENAMRTKPLAVAACTGDEMAAIRKLTQTMRDERPEVPILELDFSRSTRLAVQHCQRQASRRHASLRLGALAFSSDARHIESRSKLNRRFREVARRSAFC
jgi:hypothetical protein